MLTVRMAEDCYSQVQNINVRKGTVYARKAITGHCGLRVGAHTASGSSFQWRRVGRNEGDGERGWSAGSDP